MSKKIAGYIITSNFFGEPLELISEPGDPYPSLFRGKECHPPPHKDKTMSLESTKSQPEYPLILSAGSR